MGFFDRFSGQKPSGGTRPPNGVHEPVQAEVASGGGGVVTKPKLVAAREKLSAGDLVGAMAIYEEILSGAGDRADVLVTISGDLGSHGYVAEIVELIAPRYDADRHGPATGLNLLQAYLALRNTDAAQHVLDILFGLNRPELEDRLHGFSNAIGELLMAPDQPGQAAVGGSSASAEGSKISLISISKPIWFYGLEAMAAQILPPKETRLRRIAFAQLALPGHVNSAPGAPEDELGRLSRAMPLWLAEAFYFTAAYAPVAAIGINTPPGGAAENHFVAFGGEWTIENLRQLVETTEGGFDYIVTGALRLRSGDYELFLRIWEVKTFRERKTFNVRWTASTVDAALGRMLADVRSYMEWSPASAAYAYTLPAQPRMWLETLGASLGLFLAEKAILPLTQLASVDSDLRAAGERAAKSEAGALAYLTLRARAVKLGFPEPAAAVLMRSSLVLQAKQVSS